MNSKPGQLTAMISSTALDLPEHRKAVSDACLREGIHPIDMEHLPARDASGIRVSIEMVDQADIYIGVYAWRYGWVPDFDNPDRISITEMEFNHALERKERGELKEILVFVMHDDHPIRASDKEDGEEAQRKLKDFKQRASTGRVMLQFESTQDLHGKVIHSLADLKSRLEPGLPETPTVKANEPDTIPTPPAFYAEPDYIGSHQFVGRARELEDISDWAKPADPTNLLLYEAIGGNGKSMLTWEWTTNPKHATQVRDDWAGRFWYSFYERGAIMADFCQRALAYMTGQPLKELRKKKTAELKERLLQQLHARPWLLILDGLERVLVAYHRIDAAEMPDEDANNPTDKIVDRDPRDAIRDEDNDLLRALAAATPSKILVSSRLTPRVLLNPSGQPITGAKRITLPGLRPADADLLLRSCGIDGDSAAIQSYLVTNCDNHPLVIGVLGGLIHYYLPARGNFDQWVDDPGGGAKLDLASLDLIQRRNHILSAAFDALPPASRQLLSTLALLSESVDYDMLCALNPHQPPAIEKVERPTRSPSWKGNPDWIMTIVEAKYKADLSKWIEYHKSLRENSAADESVARLTATVQDLEHRGLLQHDSTGRWYDLHPVVRSVAVGWMTTGDKKRYGDRVLDHFSSIQHDPYREAQTLDDLQGGLQIVRTQLKLGRFHEASTYYRGDLARALKVNVEGYAELLSLLRPFYPNGWGELPTQVIEAHYMTNDIAVALANCGESRCANTAYSAVLGYNLQCKNPGEICLTLRNISRSLIRQNRIAQAIKVNLLALSLARVLRNETAAFRTQLRLFCDYSLIGDWSNADETWQLLSRASSALCIDLNLKFLHNRARIDLWKCNLDSDSIQVAEKSARSNNDRGTVRELIRLHGEWLLDQSGWLLAAENFAEAIRMARVSGIPDTNSETGLALAKHQLGQLAEPQREAERLAQMRQPAHRLLAQLWLALGDPAQAKPHALAAYKWAWADGEPYVSRYELTRTTELLQQMNVPIPKLLDYDPAKDEPFPWEADVRAAIEKLRAEKT